LYGSVRDGAHQFQGNVRVPGAAEPSIV
jgi:hypothetical protein